PAPRGVWKIINGPSFLSPVGLVVNRQGDLYVADAANHHIYKLAPDGRLLATLGSEGPAPGQFERPTALALDAIGDAHVAGTADDTANNRVQKLSSIGVPLAVWGSAGSGPGQFNNPRGVAVDHEDNVYVADTGNDRITKLSPLGQVVAQWGRSGQSPGEFRQP